MPTIEVTQPADSAIYWFDWFESALFGGIACNSRSFEPLIKPYLINFVFSLYRWWSVLFSSVQWMHSIVVLRPLATFIIEMKWNEIHRLIDWSCEEQYEDNTIKWTERKRREVKWREERERERAEQMRADCVLAPGRATEEDGDARMRWGQTRDASVGPASARPGPWTGDIRWCSSVWRVFETTNKCSLEWFDSMRLR